ncbi:MAG: GAF domain-containing sensor histidine kinase [Chloroflexota bacterium]|nr:MAG: GAF domain-containing sensor histidine kinase [Chloroflexota bacterium]
MTDKAQASLLERYRRLAEISRNLASTVDLNILLDRITEAAAHVSGSEAASILLYDENQGQLYFESATNLDEPLMRGLIVPVEGSIAGWIVTNGKPVIIDDTQSDPRHFSQVGEATNVTTNSLLGVPLIAKDKVIGALEAINKINGAFTQDDQEILMDLGAQAAVAIENARLFQQSDLIAEMVHELRTPLASLRTASHLLLRKDVSQDQLAKVVNIIDNETTRLINMTTSFLDLARLESGRIPFNSELFDPTGLLQECIGMMKNKAAEKNLRLNLYIPNELPKIKADQDKIKQVVLNLISNAVNYNKPSGTITVSGHRQQNELVISVNDTGPGIRQADMVHLFDKFYRSQATEASVQGTGLGLAICKKIVEAHDGYIDVQSEIGIGTTFSVHLPIKDS